MAYLLIDSGASGPNGCFLAYIPSSNSIYLMTNADTATVPGSVMPTFMRGLIEDLRAFLFT